MPAIFSKIDLHSHSTASDGAFTPEALVQRAISRGLTHLALTDHDCVLGIDRAKKEAEGKLELSCQQHGITSRSMWQPYLSIKMHQHFKNI